MGQHRHLFDVAWKHDGDDHNGLSGKGERLGLFQEALVQLFLVLCQRVVQKLVGDVQTSTMFHEPCSTAYVARGRGMIG